jgi:ABC-type multidrug transport system fused ATPase/permease subunit
LNINEIFADEWRNQCGIVLQDGKIIEQGAHNQLVARKSEYFNLIKNQLELGN